MRSVSRGILFSGLNFADSELGFKSWVSVTWAWTEVELGGILCITACVVRFIHFRMRISKPSNLYFHSTTKLAFYLHNVNLLPTP